MVNCRVTLASYSHTDSTLGMGAMALSLYLKHASEPELGWLSQRPSALKASAPRTVAGGTGVLDLAQSWHVLHGLLTGSPWDGPAPANILLTGGREVGPDLGCGRARLASAAETREFARYIAPLCPYKLKTGIDARRVARTRFYMAEDGLCPDLHDLHDHVVRDLPALKRYVAGAAERGDGLLLWMQ